MGTEEDNEDDEKDAKAVAESFLHSSPGSSDLKNFDSAMVVAGYPTSMEHDPKTQVLEELDARNVDTGMVKLVSEKAEIPDPSRDAVYNTDPDEIVSEVRETYGDLQGDTLVLGYCAGGVYALEALDGTEAGFVGMVVPSGVENWYKGELGTEAPGNSVFFYDEEMSGRVDAEDWQELEVSGTHHLWQDMPEDLGEAAVYLGDAAASEDPKTRVADLASTYDWLDDGGDIPVENPAADAVPESWGYSA
ncbi:MAG: hypothetical protein ABEJ36_00985 [Candidatus Nanosalina sp.]